VVTEVTPPASAPQFTSITQSVQGITLRWSGQGRVFQVQKASAIDGPYLPVSPILPDLEFTDPASGDAKNGFYRLGQW
jgi:hypothetical protein